MTLSVSWSLLTSCAATVKTEVPGKNVRSQHWQVIDGEGMLIGNITREELFSEIDIFKINYGAYSPKDSIIQLLKNYSQPVAIDVFLGTWCGDSKKNLPRFLKTLDEAHLRPVRLALCGVDRTKTDKDKLTVKNNVTRVPTMIFYRNGQEIGRITEHPKGSIEDDVLSILR